MNKSNILIIIFLASLLYGQPLFAEEEACTLTSQSFSTTFPETYKHVASFELLVCRDKKKSISYDYLKNNIQPILESAKKESYDKLKGFSFYVNDWFDFDKNIHFDKSGNLSIFNKHMANQLSDGGVPNTLSLKQGERVTAEIRGQLLDDCIQKSCHKKFEALADLLNHIQNLYTRDKIKKVIENIDIIDKSWDKYLTESREQTSFDILMQTTFTSLNFNSDDDFYEPPEYQLFVLHPTLLIENFKEAIDGEQAKEALGIEVLGFNKWQADDWGIPWGLSLGYVYTDREGVDDRGNALFIHLDNTYTIGASRRDGETGYFVTVDFLKLLSDKKSQFNSWKSDFK